MIKVFIAGSRQLSRLSQQVKRRIDNIIDKRFTVIVGDANGVDKSVQKYLDDRQYTNVIVFCMEGGCRNNVGRWQTQIIAAPNPHRRDFSYYSTKDRAMTEVADYGLMLWDGKSRGTLTSIVRLTQRGKPVVVYLASEKSFFTLHQAADLTEMLNAVNPQVVFRLDPELQAFTNSGRISHTADHAPLLF